MRKGFAALAIVGVAATVALYALVQTAPSLNLMASSDAEFIKFIAKYGKSYATKTEHQRRAEIFAKNLKAINEHNAKADKTYTLGIN